MSSSVSSERIFSQGGITITKRRNRLKGDIVEALQCIKCAIRHDILFREPAPSSALEAEAEASDDDEEGEEGGGDGEGSQVVEKGSHGLLIDEDDSDIDDGDDDDPLGDM
jgi:hypothetical protein